MNSRSPPRPSEAPRKKCSNPTSYRVAADWKLAMWPPSSEDSAFARSTMASAFHRTSDRIRWSIASSRGLSRSCESAGLVFRYGVVALYGTGAPFRLASVTTSSSRKNARSAPSYASTESSASSHSRVSAGSRSSSIRIPSAPPGEVTGGPSDYAPASLVPQARLLHQRQHVLAEVLHLLVVVKETHDHAVHAGRVEPAEFLGDLLGRADHGVTGPARDEPLLELLDLLVEGLALHARHLHHVPGGVPVTVVDDGLERVLGLLLGVPDDDQAVRHGGDVAAVVLAGLAAEVAGVLGHGLDRVERGEVDVHVAGREVHARG